MQALPLVLMAGGSILKGVAGFKAGQRNRATADANARNELSEGNAQATRIRDLARIQLGRQFTAQAESGFAVNQGSAVDSLVDSQTNAELDALDAMRVARSKSAAYRSEGKAAYSQGVFDLAGGFVGAASGVASGTSDYAAAKSGG